MTISAEGSLTTSSEASIARVGTRFLRIPLGAARGGSGATEIQVVFVTVADSDGIEGTGFTFALGGGAESMQAMIIAVFAPAMVGKGVSAWDRTWHDLWKATHRLGRGVALPALSAVDIAVWDIRGKRADQPLHRLLGTYREEIPVYGSGRATHTMSTEELIAGTRSYLDEGYSAVKLRAGARPAEEDLERIKAVRDAVGDSVRLMIDCNERLDFATALWFGRQLEDLHIFWLEEPLISDDIAGHARLASQLRLPIAVGEHLLGRFEFAQYINQQAAAILQPDAPLMGGVSEWMRVATLAEAANVAISPHCFPELHIHLCAAAKACSYIEHFPLIDGILAEPLRADRGVMRPPDRPGHGIRWNEEALERFQAR
jgi:L-alanine-DL-glutamate epimerase-like enolase superfamily enzyme